MKTRKNNSKSANRENKETRALDLFTEMMIDKIKTLKKDWRKPWFTEGCLSWPRNLSGREYNGMNSIMLLMHCERQGYELPVFLTYNRCISLNFTDSLQGRVPAVDAEGNKLPWVHVLKGEKSFPVFLTTFTVIDDNGEKIRYEDYKKLSSSEQNKYKVFPSTLVYDVFNVAQTNIKEARPDLYAQLSSNTTPAHLDRLKPDVTFGSPEYAREELVAELGAALVAQRYGFGAHIKEESAAYIKSWLSSMKKEPEFLKTTLLDVKRATSMLTQQLDAMGKEKNITEAA